MLTGKYDRAHRPANPIRAAAPLFLPQNLERSRDLVAALREVADAHSATPAQVALAWVIRHPAVVAIPSASGVEQLESNVAAADIDLTDDSTALSSARRDRFHPDPGPGFMARQISALSGSGRTARSAAGHQLRRRRARAGLA